MINVVVRSLFLLVSLLLWGCDRAPPADLPLTELDVAPGCQVQQGCRVAEGGMTVEVRFGETPRALQPFPVSLQVIGGEPVETLSVSFYMQGMDMGMNRYHLLGDAGSGWKAAVTLPICVSGRSDWVAEFELLTKQRRLRFRVPFVLHK